MKTIECRCGEKVDVSDMAVSAVCPSCGTLIRIEGNNIRYSAPTKARESKEVAAEKPKSPAQ